MLEKGKNGREEFYILKNEQSNQWLQTTGQSESTKFIEAGN